MRNQIFWGTATLVVFCAILAKTQWTPDPFCPYPSEEVTRYPYYGNCSLWWECYEGAKYVMECPEGLEFNAPLEQCDDPSIANCDPFASTTSNPNRTTSSTPSTTTVSQGGPDCSGVGDLPVYYPYEGNCSMYWECWMGDGYLFGCPSGLWWDPNNDKCSDPGPYCDEYMSTPSTTTSHGTQPDCSGTTGTVYYPFEGDCTRYWECKDGDLYLNTCPSGDWWNPSTQSCDNPGPYCDNSTIHSSSSTSSSGPTSSGTPPPGDMCTGSPSDLPYYPYPGDCTKYFECSDGFLYLYSCPGGMMWNQATSQCEPPGDFCEQYSTSPSSTTTVFQCSPSGNSYWPHPTDCHFYIQCIDGTPYDVECPPDLYYSETQKLCVSKEESECCSRLTC